MKRIGIATIHFVYNYGAMLQTYGLQKFLQDNGFDAKILDYRPYFLDSAYRLYFKDFYYKPKYAVKKILLFILYPLKFRKFNKFLRKCINLEPLGGNEKYDVLIAGSDQIWNPEITKKDPFYYLDIDAKSDYKMSYASSIAFDKLSHTDEVFFKEKISEYRFISVREKTGKKILENIIDKPINIVLDPVFLLQVDDWVKLEHPCRKIDSKYLLFYSLEENQDLNLVAQNIARSQKLKIVSIHPMYYKSKIADINLNDIGPREFLWLIHNAEYVITNSFHGTVFSILFSRKFFFLPYTKTGSRMLDLCDSLNLEKKIELIDNGDFQYYQMETKNVLILQKLIAESKKYLLSALN